MTGPDRTPVSVDSTLEGDRQDARMASHTLPAALVRAHRTEVAA